MIAPKSLIEAARSTSTQGIASTLENIRDISKNVLVIQHRLARATHLLADPNREMLPDNLIKPAEGASAKITDNVPYITHLLDQLTTDAAALPGRSDLQFHRTLERSFAKDLDGASQSVLDLTDKLVKLLNADQAADYPVARGKGQVKDEEDLTEHFRKNIGETLDALLEDAVCCGKVSLMTGCETRRGIGS